MGVVFTEHVTDDGGAFFVRRAVDEAKFVHRVKYAAVYGFEAVFHIGQSPRHYHRHCIVDERGFHLRFNIYSDNFFVLYVHLSMYV